MGDNTRNDCIKLTLKACKLRFREHRGLDRTPVSQDTKPAAVPLVSKYESTSSICCHYI